MKILNALEKCSSNLPDFFFYRLHQLILRKRIKEYQSCRILGCSFQGKKQWHQKENSDFRASTWLVGIVISGYLSYYFLGKTAFFKSHLNWPKIILIGDKKNRHLAFSEESKNDQLIEAGSFKDGLPLYSMEDVSKHVTKY